MSLQAAVRGDAGADIPLPSYLMSLFMPFTQILIIMALTVASTVPATTVAVIILKLNPGACFPWLLCYLHRARQSTCQPVHTSRASINLCAKRH